MRSVEELFGERTPDSVLPCPAMHGECLLSGNAGCGAVSGQSVLLGYTPKARGQLEWEGAAGALQHPPALIVGWPPPALHVDLTAISHTVMLGKCSLEMVVCHLVLGEAGTRMVTVFDLEIREPKALSVGKLQSLQALVSLSTSLDKNSNWPVYCLVPYL